MYRRKFIKISLMGYGSVLMSSNILMSACQSSINNPKNSKTTTFGIQLWSVQNEMASDPKGTLEQLSNFGYLQIESFEGDTGMFWGMAPKAFSAFLAKLNMRIVASHCNVFDDLDRKAGEAAEAGMDYLVCPSIEPGDNLDYYRKKADEFNKIAETCQKYGVGFAYHNHDYSFIETEGMIPQEILLEQTGEHVKFEMDVYWVVAAGADPLSWLQKYPGRWPLIHVKDKEKLPTDPNDASTLLGQGIIDFSPIIDNKDTLGIEYLIVEQERFENTAPLEAAEKNAVFMREFLSDMD